MSYNIVASGSTQTTIEKLQQHLTGFIREIGGRGYKDPVQRIVCVDGMSVSVQASQFTYAKPRTDVGPWTHVELGFPSVCPPQYILEYADEMDAPTSTVYGYVPIELVAQWINACGGLAPLPAEPSIPAQWELDDDTPNKNEEN